MRSSAFTMVELLVVMVIIVILVSAVLVAGSALIDRAKSTNTAAMLSVVNQAVQEFHREQEGNPTVTRNAAYRKRYGSYPPDELEVFTPIGVPSGSGGTLAPGGATMIPRADRTPYPQMRFHSQGLPLEERVTEFRDQVAMTVAIQTLGGHASSSLLEGIQDRYWDAPVDPAKEGNPPAVFLDRNGDGQWDGGDHQVRYIVDDWGMPISYMAQRDWRHDSNRNVASSNHEDWNEASTEFIRLNNGQPIIFSYGPDGPEQLTPDVMGDEGAASLVGDFEGVSGNDLPHRVDNPLNADNIYVDPAFKQKVAEGIEE